MKHWCKYCASAHKLETGVWYECKDDISSRVRVMMPVHTCKHWRKREGDDAPSN